MDVSTQVLSSGALPLERYAHVTGRTFPETLHRAARGVVRRGMGIMPPANDTRGAGGALTAGDRTRGYRAISRDLNTLFAPVRLKNKRVERIPASLMIRLHAEALKRKRPGAPMRRITVQPLYVDARKMATLENKLRSHVGRLASGFMAAAQAVRVSVPGWVSRHGTARGSVEMSLTGAELYFEAVNYAPNVPSWIRTEAQRRVNYALRYQAAAMNRELQHLLLKDARTAGLAATPA